MQALFPGTPFEFMFLETSYNQQYHGVQQFETLTKYFAMLAITIACLGLFALSFYGAQRRIKEIAVRKIFGAQFFDVVWLLTVNYIKVGFISCVVGSCVTLFIMNEWLENFAFSISLGSRDFLAPLAIITLIILGTVSYNCIRASSLNPSHALKH